MKQANFEKTFEGWRDAARQFLSQGIAPDKINWNQEEMSLFSVSSNEPLGSIIQTPAKNKLTVPQKFIELATAVSYARDESRWSLLYRILFRLQHENSNLLKISIDSDIQRAESLKKSVSHDIHKMHAFVRFKKSLVENEEVYVAWHRPEHLVVKPATEFFARRFGDKRWSIFTPDESAHWDLKNLTFGPGMEQNDFNATDDWENLWKTYYKSIFNPARIKIKMMKAEMSPKYWSSMPETSLIKDLIREAPNQLQNMIKNQNHAAIVNPLLSIPELREESKSCTACPLFKNATQTVFGVGPIDADIMIVGEQPGDEEDLTGNPFVGPAGLELLNAVKSAGISRDKIYITNAVKHFNWTPRGKLRMHQKPNGSEMHACKPWLEAEIAKIKPKVIIALGATAATAVTGKLPKISAERGKVITTLKIASSVIISWHPSAILRSFNDQEMTQRRQELSDDIKLALSVIN